MSSIVKPSAPAAGRRRPRGLRKLSSESISKAMDETSAQVTRIGLTFFGTSAFCFLSLFSPDSALLAGSEKINVPFGGPVSFSGFMLLGPVIVLRVYLQIYVEHSERLDRLGVTRMAGEHFAMSIGGAEKKVAHDGPRYSAIYKIDGPHVLVSREWANAVEEGRWPTQIRPFTHNRRHAVYKVR
jgi:hypothetical protein